MGRFCVPGECKSKPRPLLDLVLAGHARVACNKRGNEEHPGCPSCKAFSKPLQSMSCGMAAGARWTQWDVWILPRKLCMDFRMAAPRVEFSWLII